MHTAVGHGHFPRASVSDTPLLAYSAIPDSASLLVLGAYPGRLARVDRSQACVRHIRKVRKLSHVGRSSTVARPS